MVRTPSTMLPLGTVAPDFDLPNVDGRMVDYAAAAGPQGTVVMFICNHCPFVKHVADALARLGREFMPRGVGFVAISFVLFLLYYVVLVAMDDGGPAMKDKVASVFAHAVAPGALMMLSVERSS